MGSRAGASQEENQRDPSIIAMPLGHWPRLSVPVGCTTEWDGGLASTFCEIHRLHAEVTCCLATV